MPFRARLKRVFGRPDEADPPNPGAPQALLPRPGERTRTSKAALVPDADSSSAVSSPSPKSPSPGRSQHITKGSNGTQALELRDLLDGLQKSRLKVAVGGREIAVKDQARRVVHALLSVKEMIDFAVSMEPHSSLAWAVVLVFLNPVTNAMTQDEDASEGFENCGSFLTGREVTWKGLGESIGLWDVRTRQLLRRLEVDPDWDWGWVDAVSFSRDGSLVASVVQSSWGRSLDLWNVASGALLHTVDVDEQRVRRVAFSADGSRVFCAIPGQAVRIWDVATGAEVQRLRHHGVDAAVGSPDGEHIASSSTDKTIHIWDDTATFPAPAEVPGTIMAVDPRHIRALVSSPQGSHRSGVL
ncbi:quinon protein alcohol dehydrogenase-like superfamily [Aspergillus recurvatus]